MTRLARRVRTFAALAALACARRAGAQCPDGTPPPCAGTVSPRTRVIVTPFASAADSLSVAFAAVLTEDIGAALANARTVELLGPRTPAPRGRFVVRGRAARSGALLRVAASVERSSSGQVIYNVALEQPASRATFVRDSVIRGILGAIGVAGPALRRPSDLSFDPVANDLYFRGRYHVARRRQSDVTAAYRFFAQAIARDSSFARAWAGMAQALGWARNYDLEVPGVPKDSLTTAAVEAIRTALRLDSTNAESWLLRAQIALAVDPSDPLPARRAIEHALRLDSTLAAAWDAQAWLLVQLDDSAGAARAWARAGAGEEGAARAIEAQFLTWWRSYDSAAVRAEEAVIADPTLMFAQETVGDVAILRGRLDQAEASYEAARRLGTGREIVRSLSGLARVAAARGDTVRARTLADRAAGQPDPGHPGPDGAVAVAAAYAAAGARDSAMAWLERFRPRTDLHFQLHLRRDPALDPLRADAGFRRLVVPPPPGP